MVGLIIGTGLGSGIIIENKIFNGTSCGAGEFGMLPYLEYNYEYYCSGQFFKNQYNKSGREMARSIFLLHLVLVRVFRKLVGIKFNTYLNLA